MLNGGIIGIGNIGQQLARHIAQAWQGRARIVAACNRGPANLAIALTLEDADRAIAAAERSGVVTVVNYSLRFIDTYRTIRELARSGELGRILAVHHLRTRGYGLYEAGARHRAVVEPHESGGWTVHHACHDIDRLSWVHGPIVRVYARTASTVPGGAREELVIGLVDFADGAVGSIGDPVCRIREHATLVVGSRASLAMSGEAGSIVLRLHREGSDRPEVIPARDEKRPGGGLDHFLECVAAGRPSPDSLRSARTGHLIDVPPECEAAG
jgi:predicted dehydrogenase